MEYLPVAKTIIDPKDKTSFITDEKWMQHHQSCNDRHEELAEVVIYGASNIKRFGDGWSQAFGKKCMNFAYGGDRIEHLLYRVVWGNIPKTVSLIVVHIGSNNVGQRKESSSKIAKGIVQVCMEINARRRNVEILLTGVIPGLGRKAKKVNRIYHDLGNKVNDINYIHYIAPDMTEWTIDNGERHNPDLFIPDDQVHLNAAGYNKMVEYIQSITVKTSLPLFPLLTSCPAHLAVGVEETADGDYPPPLWDPRFAPVRWPKYMPSVETYVWKKPKINKQK